MTEDQFDLLLDKLIRARNLDLTADQRGFWWEAVHTFDPKVFRDAINRLVIDSEGYPTPALARRICRELMQERLSRVAEPPVPSGLSDQEYVAWLTAWRRSVVREESPEQARQAALAAIADAPAIEPKPRAREVAVRQQDAVEGPVLDLGW